MQDGFQDDSLRIMKDIQRFNSHCQVGHAIQIFFTEGGEGGGNKNQKFFTFYQLRFQS